MSRHFCTYFDSNFLIKGLTLYRSLARHTTEPFTLSVLCLDNFTYRTLVDLALEGLQPISLEEALQQASTIFGPNFGIDAARAQRFAQMLINSGELVRVGELVFHKQALEDLRATLQRYKTEHGARIDVGIFKDLTGVSRKYAIPLLEYLDRQRVTRRVGETREIL